MIQNFRLVVQVKEHFQTRLYIRKSVHPRVLASPHLKKDFGHLLSSLTPFPQPAIRHLEKGKSMSNGEKIPGADKKIVAGICGILLGGLGIHKFVLGYTKEGILQIVIT